MASDAQVTQSKMYWSSASPIAITDAGGRYYSINGQTYAYIFFKNIGTYPIRITGLIGADGGKYSTFYTENNASCSPATTGHYNISDYYYMGPGEEKYFATSSVHGGNYCRRHIIFTTVATGSGVGGASSICQNSNTAPGMIDYQTFGFEYIVYIDGQQITKRQIGKDFIVKCLPPT